MSDTGSVGLEAIITRRDGEIEILPLTMIYLKSGYFEFPAWMQPLSNGDSMVIHIVDSSEQGMTVESMVREYSSVHDALPVEVEQLLLTIHAITGNIDETRCVYRFCKRRGMLLESAIEALKQGWEVPKEKDE